MNNGVSGPSPAGSDETRPVGLLTALGSELSRAAIRGAIAPYPRLHPVAEVADFDQLGRVVAKRLPRVVLLSSTLPGILPCARTREALALSPETRTVVIIHTAIAPAHLTELLSIGPFGAIDASIGPDEAAQALNLVASGIHVLSASLAPMAGALWDHAGVGRVPIESLPINERERRILALLARGLSDREVAERMGVGERSIAVYLSQIKGKLETHNRVHSVALALAAGAITIEPQ
ncbi:MAG: response regulator transcription factor [Chloroflexi bacterium]|nr:response regulator transcription factor [Chloroflexota bacterium]